MGFVGAKARNAKPEKKLTGEQGDVWLWVATDADTKLVPSWLVGGRDSECAMVFMDDLASRLVNRVRYAGSMGTISKTINIGAAFALLSVMPVSASELALSCLVRAVDPKSDQSPYVFSVLIDQDKPSLRDVDGDGGVGWVIDHFSNTRIEAHFDIRNENGTLAIDRITGVIDTMTVFRLARTIVLQFRGTCVPTQKKF